MVQCFRCRRLKKKCSGDQGNGSRCEACRTSRTQPQCIFIRPESWLLASTASTPSSESTSSSPCSDEEYVLYAVPPLVAETAYSDPVPRSSEQYQARQQAPSMIQQGTFAPSAVPATPATPSVPLLTSSWPAQQRQLPSGFTDPVYYMSQARNYPQNTYEAANTQSNTLPPFRAHQSHARSVSGRAYSLL